MKTIEISKNRVSNLYYYPSAGDTLTCTCHVELSSGEVVKQTLRTDQVAIIRRLEHNGIQLCTTHNAKVGHVAAVIQETPTRTVVVPFYKSAYHDRDIDPNSLIKRLDGKITHITIKSNKHVDIESSRRRKTNKQI